MVHPTQSKEKVTQTGESPSIKTPLLQSSALMRVSSVASQTICNLNEHIITWQVVVTGQAFSFIALVSLFALTTPTGAVLVSVMVAGFYIGVLFGIAIEIVKQVQKNLANNTYLEGNSKLQNARQLELPD